MNIRNAAVFGMLASLASAVCLFLLFRISITVLGSSVVGSWVLIQSIFFVSRVAEGGAGINISRTVALDKKTGKAASIFTYYRAGLILIVAPVVVIGFILLYPARIILIDVLKIEIEGELIFTLILLCYINAILSSIAAVGLSLLEGQGRLVVRQGASILSSSVYAIFSTFLISKFNVVGLALVYVISSAAMIAVSLLSLFNKSLPDLNRSTKDIVLELYPESIRASTMIFVRVGFEPLTKFLVGIYGTMAAVAALELAMRITTQVRVFIQAACQPLLYVGVRTEVAMDASIKKTYGRAYSLIFKVNCAGLAIVCAAGPLVTYLAFGYINEAAVVLIFILATGNFINSIGIIGYYAEASSGRMSTLLRLHLQMFFLNFFLGLLLSYFLGYIGAVLAYSVSFIYGGIVLIYLGNAALNKSIFEILRANWLLGSFTFAVLVALLCIYNFDMNLKFLYFSFVCSVILSMIFSLVIIKEWRR